MTLWSKRPDYPTRSVTYLVEGYPALKHMKSTQPGRGLDLLCQLTDIDLAVSKLGPIEYVAVLLCGLLGVDEAEAGKALGVSQSTMSRRYARALEKLKAMLNGDDDEA